MSKLDTAVCGLFSYQKKAPKQVWEDYRQQFGHYLWRVLTEEIQGETKRKQAILEKCCTFESKVLTTLEIDIIVPYSKYKGIFFKSNLNS